MQTRRPVALPLVAALGLACAACAQPGPSRPSPSSAELVSPAVFSAESMGGVPQLAANMILACHVHRQRMRDYAETYRTAPAWTKDASRWVYGYERSEPPRLLTFAYFDNALDQPGMTGPVAITSKVLAEQAGKTWQRPDRSEECRVTIRNGRPEDWVEAVQFLQRQFGQPIQTAAALEAEERKVWGFREGTMLGRLAIAETDPGNTTMSYAWIERPPPN